MSSSTNPFQELGRMFRRLSRQIEETSRSWDTDEGWLFADFESMAIDLVDRDDTFVATVDLPGFDRDDVDVRVTDHMLNIDADHDETIEEDEERYLHRERTHRSVSRSIRLPDDVETDGVEATMKNGVLTVTLPKLAVEDATKIEVE